MSKLQLKSITCFKKQDLIGKDELIIKLGGNIAWSATGFSKDTTRSLETVEPRQFANQIKLELFEKDPGRDDFLGEKVIDDKSEHFGIHNARFVDRGADYEITYEVK